MTRFHFRRWPGLWRQTTFLHALNKCGIATKTQATTPGRTTKHLLERESMSYRTPVLVKETSYHNGMMEENMSGRWWGGLQKHELSREIGKKGWVITRYGQETHLSYHVEWPVSTSPPSSPLSLIPAPSPAPPCPSSLGEAFSVVSTSPNSCVCGCGCS